MTGSCCNTNDNNIYVIAGRNSPTLPTVWSNGVKVSSNTVTGGSGGDTLVINDGAEDEPSDCQISDVRIYATLLSDDEVYTITQELLGRLPAAPERFLFDNACTENSGAAGTSVWTGVGSNPPVCTGEKKLAAVVKA